MSNPDIAVRNLIMSHGQLLNRLRRNAPNRPSSRRTQRPGRQGIDNIFSDIINSYDNPNPRVGGNLLRSFQMRPVSSNLQLLPLTSGNRTNSSGAAPSPQPEPVASPNMTSTAMNEVSLATDIPQETQLSEVPEEIPALVEEEKPEEEEANQEEAS